MDPRVLFFQNLRQVAAGASAARADLLRGEVVDSRSLRHNERKLFGLYTPAQSSASGERAIVLCNPWGQEYLRAHRSMRQLSTMLTGEGYHAFRFDYYGTGDSFGDRLRETCADGKRISKAQSRSCGTPPASRVSARWTSAWRPLAANVAVKHPELVESLVLWDPIVTGSEFLNELLERPSRHEMERGRVLPRQRDRWEWIGGTGLSAHRTACR